MTREEFNEKYKNFLSKGHYGLALNKPEVVDYLDGKFQEFIKRPDFSYTQIKSKFDTYRFYCTGISVEERYLVEQKITELYNEI
jgi:hypothetical protein